VSKSLNSIYTKLRNRVTDHTGFYTKLGHFVIETINSLSILIGSSFSANNSIVQVSKNLKSLIDTLVDNKKINHSLVVRSKSILTLATK
jgi:hypothetical protein